MLSTALGVSLLLNLTLPPIYAHMTTAIVDQIHAAAGEIMAVGGKFIDVKVDISGAVPHDCPPIQHFRLTVRDRVWLRRLNIACGDELAVGSDLALFTTDRDEPLDGRPEREVRLSIAGIMPENPWEQV